MNAVFIKILNMSYIATWVILFVLIARLFLKKAPKRFSYLLWVVPLFRLLCPLNFESALSLLPTTTKPIPNNIMYATTPQINTGISIINNTVNPVLQSAVPASAWGASNNTLQNWIAIGQLAWVVGIIVLLIYSVVSLFLLYRKLAIAMPLRDNIWITDYINSPFVMGFVCPKIYLPSSLSEKEQGYIILHEQIHIKRGDHIVKLLAFLVLCIHWFNPLVWVAFMLSSKDMEMSCDESVLKQIGKDIRQEYSTSLLSLATGRHTLSGIQLAFGEGNTKSRIKNVLHYKKPAFWGVIITGIAVVLLAVCLLTNPVSGVSFSGATYRVEEVLYNAPQYSFTYTEDFAPGYCISSDLVLYERESGMESDWLDKGGLYKTDIDSRELYAYFDFNYDLNNAHKWIDKVKTIYRTDTGDTNQTFYLVMQTRNGDILVAMGYDLIENSHVRWLFRMECTNQGGVDQEYADLVIEQSLSNYAGTAVQISITGYYEIDENVIIGFQFNDTKRGFAIFHYKDGIWQLESLHQPFAVEENSVVLCGPALTINDTEVYYDILLLNLNDVAKVERVYDADGSVTIQTFNVSPHMVIMRQSDIARNSTMTLTCYDKNGSILWKNGKAYTNKQLTVTNTKLDTAVSQAILAENYNPYHHGDFAAEAHTVLKTVEEEHQVTVYAMVLHQVYGYSGGGFSEVSGSHMPVALTFEIKNDGSYDLIEYWTPEDGGGYGSSIMNKFPIDIYEKALDTQKYIRGHIQACYQQAVEYGNVDTKSIIANLITEICASPKTSSSSDEYIDAHAIAYRELLYYGSYTLDYCYTLFEQGGQTGLEGHIMARACCDILKDSSMVGYVTGQDWFDKEIGSKH